MLIGAPLAVIVLFFIIAAIAGIPPFSSSSSSTTTTLPTTPPTTPPPVPTPNPTPEGTLAKLMPPGGTDCTPNAQTFTGVTGLTASRDCSDNTDLKGTNVRAYEFDNPSDYQASLNAYGQVVGFSNLKQGCPPPTNDDNGKQDWSTPNYPRQAGAQYVECGIVSFGSAGNSPEYLWTIPTRQTFVRAIASPSTTFQQLDDWFTNHALP